MPATPAPSRYSRLTISLHWLTLLLLIVVYSMMEFRGLFPKGSPERDFMRMMHVTCGLSILVLTVIRLAVRLRQRTPPITPAPAAWEMAAAHLMHAALYAMLIALPLLAWFGINAHGHAVQAWGISLPLITGENEALGKTVIATHKLIAKTGYFLIGLHVLAALVHHYVHRDDTVRRMLPPRG